MEHIVIVYDRFTRMDDDGVPNTRRAKVGQIVCKSKSKAEFIADLLRNRSGLEAEAAVKMWQPGGGSVTLDYTAIERLVEMYTAPVKEEAA